MNIKGLSLSALTLNTLDWTMSSDEGIRAFSLGRPAGKYTAGPEWEVYFAWCMHIEGCGICAQRAAGALRTEEFITAALQLPSYSFTVISVHPNF